MTTTLWQWTGTQSAFNINFNGYAIASGFVLFMLLFIALMVVITTIFSKVVDNSTN